MAYDATSTQEGIRLLRDDFRVHQAQDREDFGSLTQKVEVISEKLANTLGGLNAIKWIIAIAGANFVATMALIAKLVAK